MSACPSLPITGRPPTPPANPDRSHRRWRPPILHAVGHHARPTRTVDVNELDRVVSAWLAERVHAQASTSRAEVGSVDAVMRAIAVDGKTTRDARDGDDQAVHLSARACTPS